jgi:APA family basic amino acid/polyamine antiporter
MPFGILVGLAVVTALYMGVASVLTGVLPLDQLAVSEPLAAALRATQHPRAAVLLSGVAVVGIASMLVVGSIGQTRILAVMARDGLMPGWMARIHPKLGTPVLSTLALGVVTAGLAACFPLDALADLVSIGTLSAFVVVMAGVLVLRYREPDRPRAFRTPWVPALPLAGIAINLYLMTGLAVAVWIRFLVWFGLGVACYALWGHASATRTLDRMPRQSKQPSV